MHVCVEMFKNYFFKREEYRYKWDKMMYRKKENHLQEESCARVPDK